MPAPREAPLVANPTKPTAAKPTKPTRRRRPATTGALPPAPHDRIYRAQVGAAEAQQRADVSSRIADLDALISRLRLAKTQGVGDIRERWQTLRSETGEARGEAKRQAKVNRAVTQRGLAGRGLALSGVRAGAEGRISEDLTSTLGRLISQRSQGQDALRRAMTDLRATTRTEIKSAKKKKQILKGGLKNNG